MNGGATTPVTFDADGNTLTDSTGRSFTWDSENRMTSCTLPSGGGTTTFTYGSDGLRRSKTTLVGGVSTTTDFVYDGTMLVRELVVGNGSIQGTYIGELITSVTYFQGPLGPAYRRNDLSGTSPHWYVYNGLGSVVGEVDQLGNLDSYQEYDAYGAPRTYTVVGTPSSRQGYVGQLGHQTDSETGRVDLYAGSVLRSELGAVC